MFKRAYWGWLLSTGDSPMSARWYKRCGADFIHGTMMLTLEEKGAYSLCLDLIYDRGGPIPDDARWLSGVCGVSIRKWNAIRERLVSLGKLTAVDGLISNVRADLEIVSIELQRRNQAESGAKGGRKRAENAGQSLQNNDLAQATLKPIEEIREDKNGITSVIPMPRAARLPVDWVPNPLPVNVLALADLWPPGRLERELDGFRDYWAKCRTKDATRLDWNATWHNRIRDQHDRVMRENRNGQQRTAEPELGRTAEASVALRERISKLRHGGIPAA